MVSTPHLWFSPPSGLTRGRGGPGGIVIGTVLGTALIAANIFGFLVYYKYVPMPTLLVQKPESKEPAAETVTVDSGVHSSQA